MVHGLVDAPVLCDEPEVDRAEWCDHATDDAGLLLDLAHRRLLGRLTGLDVPFGQRPQQPALAVEAADHRGRPGGMVHDEPTCRRLVDRAQPSAALGRTTPATPPGAAAGCGHVGMVTM